MPSSLYNFPRPLTIYTSEHSLRGRQILKSKPVFKITSFFKREDLVGINIMKVSLKEPRVKEKVKNEFIYWRGRLNKMLFVVFSIFQTVYSWKWRYVCVYPIVKSDAAFGFHCIENHIPRHQENNFRKGFLDHFPQSRFSEWHTHTWPLNAKKTTLPDSVFLHPIHPRTGDLPPT